MIMVTFGLKMLFSRRKQTITEEIMQEEERKKGKDFNGKQTAVKRLTEDGRVAAEKTFDKENGDARIYRVYFGLLK
ncbi:hypothetical protein L596_013953 [Steinernema carpocapsae]|uniref:Uncharacterized protein n=1 Tax=Steinernema carpocapsae TaxID=34508 RepID=A0A4U5N9W5_STECR|nr:hypothetical protein L596_013953 [Steinernema carpocapsae]